MPEGTYGEVSFKNRKAIKKFKRLDDKITFWKEYFIMQLFSGVDGFVQIRDFDYEERTITMEKYDCDLLSLSEKLGKPEKRLPLVKDILDQCLKALKIFHGNGFIHGDLRAPNIMCNYNPTLNKIQCFIGDFSISSTNLLYPHYDEYYMYKPQDIILSKQIDIWMLGMSIIQFITGKIIPEIEDDYIFDYRSEFTCIDLDEETQNLLDSMLLVDPDLRYSFPVYKNGFVNEFNKYYEINEAQGKPALKKFFKMCKNIIESNYYTSNDECYDDLQYRTKNFELFAKYIRK